MSRNIMTITKWLPLESEEHMNLFMGCKQLENSTENIIVVIENFLQKLQTKYESTNYEQIPLSVIENIIQELEKISQEVESIIKNFQGAFNKLSIFSPPIATVKSNLWKEKLLKTKIKLSLVLHELIQKLSIFFVVYEKNLLNLVLKIANMYNECLEIQDKEHTFGASNICSNMCPYLLYPQPKLSITSILNILSQKRAEVCSHKLIDCLLDVYKFCDASEEDDLSDTSSVEIYKAIANHVSPTKIEQSSSSGQEIKEMQTDRCFQAIEELLANEENKASQILMASKDISPNMFEKTAITTSKYSNKTEIDDEAKLEMINYYQLVLWVEVGAFLEHIILWWGASPLSTRPPHYSQHLREWINQFVPTAKLPEFVLAALSTLADALGVHVTLTSWDQQFQLALVASKSPYTSDSGQLFSNMLNNLVLLCNQCEVTNDWILGAPLEELPLVEQIPIFHRLDHSIHTTRLWVMSESKRLAYNWDVDNFFMIIQSDITNFLGQLDDLRLTCHTPEIENGGLGVHVEVCAKMREKLISEVKENHSKLKETPKQCVEILYKICRTVSLAHLQIVFPNAKYWRQRGRKMPEQPSSYVEKYLNEILTPVLAAMDDVNISNTILKIMGECLLEHIYANRIKFSHFGAYQLLTDFASIGTWISNCKIIDAQTKKKMIRNEVLRRCEGVGKLLLRSPGEKIKMEDKFHKMDNCESDSSDSTQLMPAEMYVPNQEQWLELRARTKNPFYLDSICDHY